MHCVLLEILCFLLLVFIDFIDLKWINSIISSKLIFFIFSICISICILYVFYTYIYMYIYMYMYSIYMYKLNILNACLIKKIMSIYLSNNLCLIFVWNLSTRKSEYNQRKEKE